MCSSIWVAIEEFWTSWNFDRSWAMLSESARFYHKFRPMLTKFGQCRPIAAHARPKLAVLEKFTDFDQIWLNVAIWTESRPNFGRSCPNLGDCDETWAVCDQIWTMLSKVAGFRLNLPISTHIGRTRPKLADFGQLWAMFDNISRKPYSFSAHLVRHNPGAACTAAPPSRP